MKTEKQLYLDGITLVHSWLQRAKLESNTDSIESFERLLQFAITQFEEKFGRSI